MPAVIIILFLSVNTKTRHPFDADSTSAPSESLMLVHRIGHDLHNAKAAMKSQLVTSLRNKHYYPNLLCKVILVMVTNASRLVHNGLIGATIVASGVYLCHRRQESSTKKKQLHSIISVLKPTPI